MQKQTQSLSSKNLRGYVEASNSFYQDLLGYKPEATQLEFLDNNQWNLFCNRFGLNGNSSGVYLLRNQTAIIPYQVETAPLSLFHEHFGHGLYCEQSLGGIKLIELEKRLLEEEKREFSGKRFTREDLEAFRRQNPVFQNLDNIRKQGLSQYELFAIWIEYLLSKEFGLGNDFGKKYDSLQNENKEAIDSVINFSETYGNLATFYAQGMARRTTPKRVRKLLEEIYGDKIKGIRLALLYGSKKPFSDIDVFIVGDEIFRVRNNWIDVFAYSPEEFEEKLRLFDDEITDPLFSGEIIFGEGDYFEQQRQRLKEQLITNEAISYNLKESQEQGKLAQEFPENSRERKIGLSYSCTHLANALALKKGKRLLTKESLLYSLSEIPTEVKGGIE